MPNNQILVIYLILFLIINISSVKVYHEFNMISNITNYDLEPLHIISKDNICPTYIPSLFNPIPLIKYGDYEYIFPQFYYITVSHPIIGKSEYEIYKGNLIDNNIETIFGIKVDLLGDICYFGLSSGLPSSIELKKKYNTLDYLKNTNQIEKKIFSIDKWDLNAN